MTEGGFWGPEFTEGPPPIHDRLEQFVDREVDEADVTVVLIGARTASCEHVLHSIRRSAELGRGMIGIYIDQCRNRYGSTSERGRNPFDRVVVYRDGREDSLADSVPIYDWVADDGYANLQSWVAEAMTRSTAARR